MRGCARGVPAIHGSNVLRHLFYGDLSTRVDVHAVECLLEPSVALVDVFTEDRLECRSGTEGLHRLVEPRLAKLLGLVGNGHGTIRRSNNAALDTVGDTAGRRLCDVDGALGRPPNAVLKRKHDVRHCERCGGQ